MLKTSPPDPRVLEDLKACVLSYCAENPNPPTLEEIQTMYKQKNPDVRLSTRALQYWLEILVAKGGLKKLKSAKRKFAPISWSGPQTPVYSSEKTV